MQSLSEKLLLLQENDENICIKIKDVEINNNSIASKILIIEDEIKNTSQYNIQLNQQLNRFIQLETTITSRNDLEHLTSLVLQNENLNKEKSDITESNKINLRNLKQQIIDLNNNEDDLKKCREVENIHEKVGRQFFYYFHFFYYFCYFYFYYFYYCIPHKHTTQIIL